MRLLGVLLVLGLVRLGGGQRQLDRAVGLLPAGAVQAGCAGGRNDSAPGFIDWHPPVDLHSQVCLRGCVCRFEPTKHEQGQLPQLQAWPVIQPFGGGAGRHDGCCLDDERARVL